MSAVNVCRVFRLLNVNKNCSALLNLQERHIKRWVAPTFKEIKRRQDKRERFITPKLPNHRNTYLEWNLEAELYAFKRRLNEDYKDDLLLQAFTHRTYLIQEEMKQKAVGIKDPDIKLLHNDELADEGEAFMRDYIPAYLAVALPRYPAEGIAAITEHLTSTDTMGHIASGLGCKDLILAAEYPVTVPTLCKTFQALVGALIHSSGADRAANFVRDFVITMLSGKDVNDYWIIDNPIQMLDDLLKKEGKENIEYRLITRSAVNTLLACYHVGLYINKELFVSGFGESVAIAKEMTAREGLKKIFGTQENMPPLNFKLDGILEDKVKSKYISNA